MGDRRIEHHEHKLIHTDEYEGPDRRCRAPNGRRGRDALTRLLPWIMVVGTLITSALSAGISYGTTQAALKELDKSKVDKTEFITKNAEQDRQREELRELVLQMKSSIDKVTPEVQELNARLKQFYCEGKGNSCR